MQPYLFENLGNFAVKHLLVIFYKLILKPTKLWDVLLHCQLRQVDLSSSHHQGHAPPIA